METSPADRLANLFTAGSLPSKPTPDQAHIIDQDAAKMAESTKSSWKIPEQAEYPRQVHGERPKPASGADLLTSSDDDDYVAAFTEKTKMKTAKPKWHDRPQPRKMPEADAYGYIKPSRIEAKAPIEFVANGKLAQHIDDQDDELPPPKRRVLPQDDGKGNAVTGHFCVFSLVAKFPYKYMQDGNGRVSRHFFANNKFFERQWDL